jgi:NitT/TauT family transport system substrate-binding protein
MRAYNRRQFAISLAGAGAIGLLPTGRAFAAEPPPETKTIRLKKSSAICFAPYYVVEAFLHAEGVKNVQYVDAEDSAMSASMMDTGELDFDLDFAGRLVHDLDTGRPITALGGLHVGCYELFAREPIHTISDLKGKRVGINDYHLGEHLFISIMAAYVGLDPKRDIEWVTRQSGATGETDVGFPPEPLELFATGQADAFLGFPPEPQILRARGHNRVILNTVLDHPWSQYFCCVMFGNRAWVRDHPVTTKRFLRAMYKAAEFCTANPTQAAQRLVDGGYAERYEYALETIELVPYDLWHEYNAEDTMRFYALRLHDAGMLNNPPNALLAEGTDWRFLNELKREMKG